MKINAEKLAEEIQESIESIRQGFEAESFAIYADGGIEVQIKVTQNQDDFIEDVLEGIIN